MKNKKFTRQTIIRTDEFWIELLSGSLWRHFDLKGTEANKIAKSIFEQDLKPVLNEITEPKNDPAERLRNKLSPFMNLVQMLSNEDIASLAPSKQESLNEIIRRELVVCKDNIDEVHDHLLTLKSTTTDN